MAIENAVNYSLRVIKPVLDGKASVAEVKRSAEESYAKRIQDALQHTVWMTGCNSWYIRGQGGKIWNGSTYPWAQSRYWYECLFPVWKDWEFSGPATGKSSVAKPRNPAPWVISFAVLAVSGALGWAGKQGLLRLESVF